MFFPFRCTDKNECYKRNISTAENAKNAEKINIENRILGIINKNLDACGMIDMSTMAKNT
jgi:hypothetical protein